MTNLHITKKRSTHSLNLIDIFIFLFWVFGLFFGWFFTDRLPLDLLITFRAILAFAPSLIARGVTLILPTILVFLAYRLSKPVLIFPIITIKAFCYSCCIAGFKAAWGSAGWLVSTLLMISDTASAVMLLWFCFHLSARKQKNALVHLFVSIFISVLITAFDLMIISPFCDIIFNY